MPGVSRLPRDVVTQRVTPDIKCMRRPAHPVPVRKIDSQRPECRWDALAPPAAS